MTLIHRILCPVDFSETSLNAFQYSERLARALEAELLLAHAFDRPAALTATGQSLPADPHLRSKLDAVAGTFPEVKINRVLHVGPPGEVICWLAANRSCDLIVMGTHGRTGLKHLVLGSVTEYVMRHACCPVLTVRASDVLEPPPKEPLLLPIPAPRLM